MLVTSTRYDPSTPYEGAVLVAELLPNSRLLTVDGWGHTTLFLSKCATQAESDYLVYGILPEDGKVCTQDLAPFPAQLARTLKVDDAREKRARAMSSIISGQIRSAQ